jgi:hypothetical protein
MGRKSKQKGSGFERHVAKLFAEITGVEWVRTPMSGGWGKQNTKGDLIAPIGSGYEYIFVECKKGEGWDLWSTLFFDCGPMRDWWEKAVEQANEEHKVPVLIMAQNNRAPIALFKRSDFNKGISDAFFRMRIKGDAVILTSLDTFFLLLEKQKQ